MISSQKQIRLLFGTVFQLKEKQFLNIADKVQISIEQSNGTTVRIPDLDMQFNVSRIDVQKGLECQSASGKYLILFDKAENIEEELTTLQQELNELTINRRLFSQKVEMQLPDADKDVQFQIILHNGQYFIDVRGARVTLDSTLDFDINKFTNRLQWYNKTRWCVTFPDLEAMAQLQKVMIDVLSKVRKTQYKSAYQSRYEADPDSEDILQELFFDSVQFSSQIVQSFKQTLELGELRQIQQIDVFPGNFAKLPVSQGTIVISRTYRFVIISQQTYLSIYTQEGKLTSHNGIFQIVKDGRKMQPLSMMLTNDQRSILFISSKNTVCLYSVEKSQIIDEIVVQLAESEQLLTLNSSNGRLFYCISQHTVYEIEFKKSLKVLRSRKFGSWTLSSLLNCNDKLLLGDDNGIVRVYNTFEAKRSANNFITTGEVRSIEVCKNSNLVVVCTRHRIFLFVTGSFFYERLKKEEKMGRQLTISIADRDRYRIQEYDFKVARLIFNDSCVVSWTHNILIVWMLRRVIVEKKGTEYKMLQLPGRILDVRELEVEMNLIVNLQHSVVVLTIDSIV